MDFGPDSDFINSLITKDIDIVTDAVGQQLLTGKSNIRGVDRVTLEKLLADLANIEKIRLTLIKFYQWKKTQYEERRNRFEAELKHDTQVYNDAGLTAADIKELSSDVNHKLIISYFKAAIDCIQKKITTLKNTTPEELRKDFNVALHDPTRGLFTILVPEIVDQLSNMIATLIRGYQAFSTDFQNIVIVGPAGVGKTDLANTLAFIFKKLHIVCIGNLKIVTRADIVAAFLGQTAPKTRIALYSSLESVLFIDEAYQVGGCPKQDQYGMEALTELVNFLDKYVGLSIVIVAGYEKEMDECFFERNEGLRRRFPNKYRLDPYDTIKLFRVFLTKVIQSLSYDPFNGEKDMLLSIYKLIEFYHQAKYFPNMGGDMLILAGRFIRYFLSTGNVYRAIDDAILEYCSRDHTDTECQAQYDEYRHKARAVA